jgi:formylglycine-generating enzyme required for sulfatase activity
VANKVELLLGRIAVREGILKPEQVMDAVHAQENQLEQKPLGRILLERGHIKEKDLEYLLALQQKELAQPVEFQPLTRKAEGIFGKIAVQLGYITSQDMHICLREQAQLEGEGKTARIGEICIGKGFLDVDQVRHILKVQKMDILACVSCGAQFNVAGFESGQKIRCGACGAVLSVPEKLAEVGVESETIVAPKKAPPPQTDVKSVAESLLKSDAPSLKPPSVSMQAPVERKTDVMRSRGFAGYEIMGEIARGGMGIVYKAKQRGLNRIVALKVLIAGEDASEELIQRFKFEAESAASLRHPNIVAIREFGEDAGRHYFTMDFIEGQDLSELSKAGLLTVKAALTITKKVALALQYAHSQGKIHRDVKPKNIIIDDHGEPHITDFGLARNVRKDSSVTQAGAVMGTPTYMPPEQAQGDLEKIGPAADVYSLGATLYELLTGRPPFEGRNAVNILNQVLNKDPVSPRKIKPNIPVDVETIVLKAMEKEISRRYACAGEFAEDLRRFLEGEAILARPASFGYLVAKTVKRNKILAAAIAAALILVIATAVFFSVRDSMERERLREKLRDCLSDAESFIAEAVRHAEADEFEKAAEKYAKAVENYTLALGIDKSNLDAAAGKESAEKALKTIRARVERAEIMRIAADGRKALASARAIESDSSKRAEFKRTLDEAYKIFERVIERDRTNSEAVAGLFEAGRRLADLNIEDHVFARVDEILADLSAYKPGDPAIAKLAEKSKGARRNLDRFNRLVEKGDSDFRDPALIKERKHYDAAIASYKQAALMRDIPEEMKAALKEKHDCVLYQKYREVGEEELKKAADALSPQEAENHSRAALAWLRKAEESAVGGDREEVSVKVRDLECSRALVFAEGAIGEQDWDNALYALNVARQNTDDPSEISKIDSMLKKVRDEGFREAMRDTFTSMELGDLGNAVASVKRALVFQPRSASAKTLEEEIPLMKKAPKGAVLVFSTSFSAGSPDPEDKNKEHYVNLRAFYVSITEVTNSEYKQFVDAGAYGQRHWWDKDALENIRAFVDQTGKYGPATWENGTFPVGAENLPVCGISFYEARAYAKWKLMRLPTEDEWECAAAFDARSERKRVYPWGDRWSLSYGSFAVKAPLEVGSIQGDLSPWGVLDMGGSAMEWTTDARGGASVRGGSFGFTEDRMKSLARSAKKKTPGPFTRARYFGVRLVQDAKK